MEEEKKKYSAQEMRIVADNLLDVYVNGETFHKEDVVAMLRQAAETEEDMEKILKTIKDKKMNIPENDEIFNIPLDNFGEEDEESCLYKKLNIEKLFDFINKKNNNTFNNIICNLIELLEKNGDTYRDNFPIQINPIQFTISEERRILLILAIV